jgi:twitching motility protein PilT
MMIDNNKLANLIFSNNFATREQIMNLWPYISADKNIGSLLVETGVLPSAVYTKMLAYLSQQPVISPEAPSAPNTRSPEEPARHQPQHSRPNTPQPVMQQPQPEPKTYPAHDRVQRQHDITTTSDSQQNNRIIALLSQARNMDASDLHLSANKPIMIRQYGKLTVIGDERINDEQMTIYSKELLTPEQFAIFDKTGDLEFVLPTTAAGRFRVTLIKQRSGWDLTARCIPDKIRSFEESGMPQSCKSLTQWTQGLVLVTGPAGCGKSSSLCTLIEMLNQTRTDHIITIESPIEQIFTPAKSQITQREIGKDTKNQESALRAALREDPDIIVVGELRDLNTIQLAVSAAETGHLVFGTMNTICASRTIYRLIDSFPPEEQGIIRNMVSESLRGVISQQLVPKKDGTGLAVAYEVLLVNHAVANMIRKDEAHHLGTAMITGKASGMLLLDDSLKSLLVQGIITQQEFDLRVITKSNEK